MATRDEGRLHWLHIPLVLGGFLAFLGTVIVTLLVLIFLAHLVIGLILGLVLGAPISAITHIPSGSLLVAGLDDLYAWLAGALLFIALLPYFASYNDWLGRVLYDGDLHSDHDC